MRILEFTPSDRTRRFYLLYSALCFAKAPIEGQSELRKHGHVLTVLETIGEITNPDRGENESASWACPAGGKVVLSEDEYQIAKRFLKAFFNSPMFPPLLSREMTQAIDWIEEVPQEKDVKPGQGADAAKAE
jgi:hypothetical protein